MRGNGGFWNRAGRRSGGDRPTVMHVGKPYMGVYVKCSRCGNDRLPVVITQHCTPCRETAALLDKVNREFGPEEVARRFAQFAAEDASAPTPGAPPEGTP